MNYTEHFLVGMKNYTGEDQPFTEVEYTTLEKLINETKVCMIHVILVIALKLNKGLNLHILIAVYRPWLPHWLENVEKWEYIFQSGKSQEILNVLEKSGNFTQNAGKERKCYSKYWKCEGILISFYFYFFSNILVGVYVLNNFLHLLKSLHKTLKIYSEGQGYLSVRKSGNHVGIA